MSNQEHFADCGAGAREGWALCTGTLFGACRDGRMEPWRGSDGHNGTEWFYTCDRCGRTS